MRHMGMMGWRCLIVLLVNPNLEYRGLSQILCSPIWCLSYLFSLTTTTSGVH